MTKYEIMFIVKSTMEEDKIKKTSEDLQKLINKKPSKVIEVSNDVVVESVEEVKKDSIKEKVDKVSKKKSSK